MPIPDSRKPTDSVWWERHGYYAVKVKDVFTGDDHNGKQTTWYSFFIAHNADETFKDAKEQSHEQYFYTAANHLRVLEAGRFERKYSRDLKPTAYVPPPEPDFTVLPVLEEVGAPSLVPMQPDPFAMALGQVAAVKPKRPARKR